jgi:hypothetical protein
MPHHRSFDSHCALDKPEQSITSTALGAVRLLPNQRLTAPAVTKILLNVR